MKSMYIKIAFFLFVCGVWSNHVCAQSSAPVTKIDGTSAIVVAWQDYDNTSFVYRPFASYNGYTSVDLSNASTESATCLVLAASTDSLATTKAVAVWKVTDRSSGNAYINVATTTANGWTAHSAAPISPTDGSEYPSDDCGVAISADGQTISVVWSTYVNSTSKTVIRNKISVDGGVSWLKSASVH